MGRPPKTVTLPSGTVRIPKAIWQAATVRAERLFISPESVIVQILALDLAPELQSVREPAHDSGPARTLPADIERTGSGKGSGFKGVYPHGRRFRAVYKNGTLGVYDTAEEAAIARYDVIQGELEGEQATRAAKLVELDAREAVARAARQRKAFLAAPYTRNSRGQAVATPLYASDGKTVVLTSEERAELLLEKGLKPHEIVLANGQTFGGDGGEAAAAPRSDGEATTTGTALTVPNTCWCGAPATIGTTCAEHALGEDELAAIEERVKAGAIARRADQQHDFSLGIFKQRP